MYLPMKSGEGSILKDTAYTGLIIRDETVVNAEADGYVNYFAPEGSKVGAKTRVYTLSDKKRGICGCYFRIPGTDFGRTVFHTDEDPVFLRKF